MKYYIIASCSMTYGQRMIKSLQKAGINSSLKRQTGESGCVYGVRVKDGKLGEALQILKVAGFDTSRYKEEPNDLS